MRVPCLQVRYNAVRRQTAAKAGEKELQVLDYQNTNAELMPLVAAAYALIFMVCLLTAVAAHAFIDLLQHRQHLQALKLSAVRWLCLDHGFAMSDAIFKRIDHITYHLSSLTMHIF